MIWDTYEILKGYAIPGPPSPPPPPLQGLSSLQPPSLASILRVSELCVVTDREDL